MPWYKAGTVSVTQNSNAVIGTGTGFIANSRVGDAFRGPDGGWYEVTNIASGTAMSISPNYQGPTNAEGAYALAPMQGYVKDSADALRALVNQFGGILAVLGEVPTQAGVRQSLNLTNTDGLPEGETNKYMSAGGVRSITLAGLDLTQPSALVATDTILTAFGKLQAAKAVAGVNADITELNGLTKPIAPAQGGVGPGYIEGLIPQWVSSTSISLSSGAAFIPGPAKTVVVPTTLTLAGLTLTANTWYYLYLYDGSGTATIELVTNAPSATYSGSARTKSGDATRRFICALRVGVSGLRSFMPSGDMIFYTENQSALAILSGGTATSSTVVSASQLVPVTTSRCSLGLFGGGGTTMSVGFPGGGEILSCGAGSRFVASAFTDSSQNIRYLFNGAPSTGGTISVSGYGMDR